MPQLVVLVLLAIVAFAAPSARGQSCVSFLSPPPQFTASVGQKVDVQVQVGACLSSPNVAAKPDSEDSQIVLTPQGGGVWAGSWWPSVTDSAVTLAAVATSVGASVVIEVGYVSGSVQKPPPAVTFSPGTIPFAVVAEGPPSTQLLTIANNDMQPHTVVATASGGAWISVSSTGGLIQPQSNLVVPVQVDPSALSAGPYNGSVSVTSDGAAVPVGAAAISVAVSPPAAPIQITPSVYALPFQANTTGSPSSQPVTLTNSNGIPVNVAIQSSASPASWMTVTPSSFTIAANSAQTLTVTATPGTLAAGEYSGTISVQPAGGAPVPPITATLTLQSPPANLMVRPMSVALVEAAGGAPATAIVTLQNPGSASAPYTVTGSASWLSVSPTAGSVPASGSAALAVIVDPTNLVAGTYSATLTIATASSTTAQVSVNVGVEQPTPPTPPTPNCMPTFLVAALQTPAQGATVYMGVPSPVSVTITDNCGASIPPLPANYSTDVVELVFSDAEPIVKLGFDTKVNAWTGSWIPAPTAPLSPAPVYVSAYALIANMEGMFAATQETPPGSYAQVFVWPQPNATAPQPVAVINGASFNTSTPNFVVAGGLESIYGSNLSDCTAAATSLPFPTQLCGTQVSLGGTPLPLLAVSAGQANVLIPQGVPQNVIAQLVVQRDNTLSVPFSVVVADLQPGIFTTAQSGQGQGAVLINGTGTVAGPAGPGRQPVSREQYVEIYATGLGSVVGPGGLVPLADGQPAPTSITTLFTTVTTPTVTVGGVSAPVIFAGLAPGYAGLYQVDVQVPSSAPVGSAVPLVLTMTDSGGNSVSSQAGVTIAVQ